MTDTTDTTRYADSLEFRREARAACGAYANCPVEVIEGASPPVLRGETYHWTNRSGERVYHPSSYARKGWSSLVYVSSTLHVVVGADWRAA